jgi:hypothetical protein
VIATPSRLLPIELSDAKEAVEERGYLIDAFDRDGR